jgi:hypothetical protein
MIQTGYNEANIEIKKAVKRINNLYRFSHARLPGN